MRCSFETCRKKLSIVQKTTKCRCGNCFCDSHFHYDDHKCEADVKKSHKEILKKNNPVVVSDKVLKI